MARRVQVCGKAARFATKHLFHNWDNTLGVILLCCVDSGKGKDADLGKGCYDNTCQGKAEEQGEESTGQIPRGSVRHFSVKKGGEGRLSCLGEIKPCPSKLEPWRLRWRQIWRRICGTWEPGSLQPCRAYRSAPQKEPTANFAGCC